jgi:pterin-4a-carbinolamine dehydratase
VSIHLTTHDAGNVVTDKDRKLAEAISAILWFLEFKVKVALVKL